MNFDTQRAARLALIGLAAASLAACASRPTPEPVVPEKPAPVTQPAEPAKPYTPPPVPQQPIGPVPGSTQDFVVNIGERIYFDTDEYVVRADAQPVLAGQAQWLNRYPAVKVRIEGNADERGTREYNLALGARRANAVRDFLVAQGVAASRIETLSYGKERPVDAGTTEEAWAKNRNARTALTDGTR